MKGIGRHYNLNHFGMSTTVVRRESCSAKRSLASRRGAPRRLMTPHTPESRDPLDPRMSSKKLQFAVIYYT